MIVYWFFFFQAEDGIRDIGVTGVQTCALPISLPGAAKAGSTTQQMAASAQALQAAPIPRSEEHTSELQSRQYLVCRLLLEKKKTRHNKKDKVYEQNNKHTYQMKASTTHVEYIT